VIRVERLPQLLPPDSAWGRVAWLQPTWQARVEPARVALEQAQVVLLPADQVAQQALPVLWGWRLAQSRRTQTLRRRTKLAQMKRMATKPLRAKQLWTTQ
jgi:hypothetical protein